ncbi:MAG: DUF4238 domain-containing protein [Candidatus Poribacteria bacterium]|nr:DUF4238 domain-containing protein [Candidatus Poribacteria bacterium]
MAKHHYVSKFYYKEFTFNPERSLVYSMDNESKISNRPKSIRKISFEQDYNTPEQEQEQSQLEREYAEILREFIKAPNPNDLELSRDFIEFVCFLVGNNPYIRGKLDEGFGNMDLQIKDAPGDHYISMPRGHKGKFDWSLAFADAVFEEFLNWRFVRLETNGYKVFITSDNPVSIINPQDVRIPIMADVLWRDPKVVNFGNEDIPVSDGWMSRKMEVQMTLKSVDFGRDVIMIFPVTPSVCLLGFSNNTRHLRYMNRTPRDNNDILAFMNLITFSQCNKVVYSHSKELLKSTKINLPKFLNHCQRHGYPPSFEAGIA